MPPDVSSRPTAASGRGPEGLSLARPVWAVLANPWNVLRPAVWFQLVLHRPTDSAWHWRISCTFRARTAPIPSDVVALLQCWLDAHQFAPTDLIFRSRIHNRPPGSNLRRAWHVALLKIGHDPLRSCECPAFLRPVGLTLECHWEKPLDGWSIRSLNTGPYIRRSVGWSRPSTQRTSRSLRASMLQDKQ